MCTNLSHWPLPHVCTLLRNSVRLAPFSVTSAISSAWLWRNLWGTVFSGSHWSTFAWHCNWQSQSAYHGPGDRQTLILQVSWGRVSLIDWQTVTEPLGHYWIISAQQESNIMWLNGWECAHCCFCTLVYIQFGCFCECGRSSTPRVQWQLRILAVTSLVQPFPWHTFTVWLHTGSTF